eukprot:TRINITY_DN5345_c0_g2_i1.p1 TRINITY_DN5345_c0_g2~~TRINITY_DN5345_c0_g2_i1.p1  ORF type:complete len:1779 (+),score=620.02 TRINITY_DN5345_c0_g2_i1:119-5338(+)
MAAGDVVYDLCVVGSGISGLAAVDAYLTARPEAKVLVLERDGRLGGHEYTVEVPNGGEKVLVDCGFMVYNERTYPNMLQLFAKYGVETKLSDMSLSTYYAPPGGGGGDDTWSFGGSGAWVLHNVWRPRLWRFLGAHKRFRTAACAVLASEDVFAKGGEGRRPRGGGAAALGRRDATLGEFCAFLQEAEFCDHWLRPFVKAVWSLPSDDESNEYPLLALLRFMENHGFLADPSQLTPWRTPKHRSEAIVAAVLGFTADSPNRGRDITCVTEATVTGVAEDGAAARVDARFPNGAAERFSARHVVLAGSGPTQAAITAAGLPARHAILTQLSVSHTKGVLHRDARYMPARKSDWAAWNVGKTHTTYWLNKIQGQPEPNLFFTLPLEGFWGDDPQEGGADADLGARIHDILHVWDTTHPRYDKLTPGAVAALKAAARGSRVQHAGAWMRHGFHEDGIVSGRLAARELLATAPEGDAAEACRLPVYYPMATNPNAAAERLAVPLLHAVLTEGEDKKAPVRSKSFESTWHGACFDSRSPPPGVLAADHAFDNCAEEGALLQDAAIRDKFLAHAGVFPAGPIKVWTMPRAAALAPAFNPFSWYVAYDDVAPDEARPVAFLAEVHNTPWGEHVFYGWAHDAGRGFPYSVAFEKTMHVSPMHPPPGDGEKCYTFDVKNPKHVTVTLKDAGKPAFMARFAGDEAAPSATSTGSVRAFAEVYYRAAMRLARGERSFYGYHAEVPAAEAKENAYVWTTLAAHWLLTCVCFLALFPAIEAWRGGGGGGGASPVGFAVPLLVAAALYLARGWHASAETDLGSGLASGALFFLVRCLLPAPNAAWALPWNACYLLIVHGAVLQAAPLSRSTRVAVQALEPVLLRLACGRAAAYAAIEASLFNPRVGNADVERAIEDAVFATGADGVRAVGNWDVFLTWFLLWVALRLCTSAALQLFVYPWRAHPRIIGARAAFHRAAEISSVSVQSTANALVMAAFAVRFWADATHDGASVVGGVAYTEFQCCSFGAYCLSDAFLGLIYYSAAEGKAEKKKKHHDPAVPSPPNAEAPAKPASPGTPPSPAASSSSASSSQSASGAPKPKKGAAVPPAAAAEDVTALCADCGFNSAVVMHHTACLTIACLGVQYLLWRHEFVWMAGFELSSPFMYAWVALRAAGTQQGMLSDALPQAVPLRTAVARFAAYVAFLISFFWARIVGCAVGLYYCFYHRLPYTFANDRGAVFGDAAAVDFKAAFWVTLAAFVPLVVVQGLWFAKLVSLAPVEALPLMENVLNVYAGDDWFDIRLVRKAGKKTAAAGAEAALPAPARPAAPTRHARQVQDVRVRPRVRVVMHRPWDVLWAFATRGDVGFGEAYVRQAWTAEVLSGEVEYDAALAAALQHLCRVSYRGAASDGEGNVVTRGLARLGAYLLATPDHANVDVPDMVTSESRQESVAEHYDGNQALFNAFQGASRVYTAAQFGGGPYDLPPPAPAAADVHAADAAMSAELDRAQAQKILHILRDLGGLAAGQKVLDLGCGYGELVRLAVEDCGAAEGVGVTNSVEMAKEFNHKNAEVNSGGGVRARVDVADMLELPRGYSGRFDLVTSVESIEAIHYHQYRTMARNVRQALRPGGRAVFQIIHGYGSRNPTIRRKEFVPGTTFVQVYIFPGQQLPYLEYVLDAFRAEGLPCTHIEHSGLHYARTLQIWREKLWYETFAAPHRAAACTWSREEYRKFAYYLAWCEAGFREGVIDVARCVFVKE